MNGKVLIVDDDANMRESISDNLDVSGYEVAQAESGAAAIAAVKSKFFDVILMDYNLTDSTGIDVIKQIRTINTESKIIMLTAHASLDTAVKAIQESVFDFLSKPVDFDKLKHSIGNALMKLRDEQELRQKNEQIARLNQMKSKFMSMSSHDLSNSLMTLQVSFEMLSQTITPNEEQKKKMVYISNGIGQIARLIEDLVDWASIEQGKFRLEQNVFNPGQMVQEALIGPQARASASGVALSAQIEAGLPMISADKKRLTQVLNNLLENAIRHTSRGGQIVVGVNRKGAEVQVAVRDSGEGISPDDVGKIFQSFYQGHGQSGGGRLGLGLSIAKEIVEAHKGRLWVESPGLGKGATFFYTVPATP
ncbi:MAG: response regulator [Elusimicrobia bacterium]|nr:response regulator [Elusimicrobiota bacterium]